MDIVAANLIQDDPDPKHPTTDSTDGFLSALGQTSEIELPDCAIMLRGAAIKAAARQNLLIKGPPGRPGPAYEKGGARIFLIADDKTVEPHTEWVLDFVDSARTKWQGVTIKIPNVYSPKGGFIPNHIGGVRFGASVEYEDLSIEGGSSCMGRGGIKEGFDHSHHGDAYINGGGFAINYLPGSNTAGDERWGALDLFAGCACVALAQSASSGVVGNNMQGIGWYAPGTSVLRYRDGSMQGGGQFGSNDLGSVSAEFAQDAVFFDECAWDKQGGVNYGDNNWHQGFYEVPRPGSGWGTNMVVSDYVPQTDGTVLVTVKAPLGFDFRDCGMWVDRIETGMIVGESTIKLGSIVGSWLEHVIAANALKSQIMNVTFTLTKALAQPPTTIHVNMPKLGAVVAHNISPDWVYGKIMRPTSGKYSVYYAPGIVHNVFMADGIRCWALSKVWPLFGGNVGTGNRWGVTGVQGISGQMASSVVADVGDLLMGPENSLQLSDGSRKSRGWTMCKTAPGGAVDAQYDGGGGRNAVCPVTCRNRNATDVPAQAPLAPDPKNPGGVKIYDPATDREKVGLSYTTIPANGLGQLLESWL